MRGVGDRVALAAAPDWVGAVDKVRNNGTVDVALDLGGRALGMGNDELIDEQPEDHDRESDLREEAQRERKRKRATSDKSWPPSTMETKVPRQGEQK